MTYVPTLCVECWRVHLAPIAAAQTRETTCKTCGADSRVVPGRSFAESEREAFEELSAIVTEGSITPVEAAGYAVQVEHTLWSGSYRAMLGLLAVRLPGFLPHEIAAGKNSGAQRSILNHLKTVLDALATARRESAEYRIVADPSLPRAGRR